MLKISFFLFSFIVLCIETTNEGYDDNDDGELFLLIG